MSHMLLLCGLFLSTSTFAQSPPAGTIIINEAVATATTMQGDPYPAITAQVTTVVSDEAAVDIGFYDQSFARKQFVFFESEEFAYVEVTDAGANLDTGQIESISVSVTASRNEPSPALASAQQVGDIEQLQLLETSADSGIFQGRIAFDLSTPQPGDGILSVEPNARLNANYTDTEGVGHSAVDLASNAIAVFQPSTAVFNSISGNVVPGAAVQLLTADGSPPQFADGSDNIFISNRKGEVVFPELAIAPGQTIDLRLEVSAPPDDELSFPSVVGDENLPSELSSGKTTRFGDGSRGEVFTVSGLVPFVRFDIPLDPPVGNLRVSKTGSESQIAIGEIMAYELEISNLGRTPIIGTQLFDLAPLEFRYISGSSNSNDSAIDDPVLSDGTLIWRLPIVAPGETIYLTYQMMVGIDAQEGYYTNSAYASGNNLTELVESNIASHEVKVSEGIFSRNGTVLGRVYVDLNGNGSLDNDEPGVDQAVVLMEDGSYVLTDQYGRYSFRNIRPGQHVLRLDDTSLPLNMRPAGSGGRFLNRADSQWLEMNASGLLKANFPATPIDEDARREIENSLHAVNIVEQITEPAETESDIDGLELRTQELQELVNSFTSSDLAIVNLSDQQQLTSSFTDIRIRYPSGATVELYINDSEIGEDNLGAVVEGQENGAALNEWVAIRLTDDLASKVTVKLVDPFGNERGSSSVTVFPAAPADSVQIVFDESVNPIADGRTLIPVVASILNVRGAPTEQVDMVSIDVRPARIVEEDADPASPGHQIRTDNGVARFTIRAPRQPGPSRVMVQANSVRSESEIHFLPHLRGLMVVGSGDITVGSGKTDGGIEELDNIFGDKIEDDTITDGHLGVFVNGAITEKTLLTATYDSAKERPEDFFFAREQQVDEESIPAVTGDGSQIGYSGSSRDKLYLRLDREKSHVVWGDYRTELGENQLSFYNRTFTGFRSEIQEENFRVTGFAAEMEQDQVVDAIPANGTSGYYFLTSGPLILGSERVVLETRDRLRPDVVIDSVQLTRNTDYDIDYYEGSILTRSPIPTYDEALNPNILIVTYEVENKTNDQWAYGARAEFDLLENLTIGAAAVVEESVVDDYGLQGADIKYLAAGINTLFTAEYSQTQSVFDLEGNMNSEDGSAVRFGFDGRPLENMDISGYYQDVDEFFSNQSALDVRRGTTIFGIDGSYKLNEMSSFNIAAFEEEDELNENSFSHVSAGWQGQVSKFLLGAELYSDQFDSDKIAPTALADGGKSANETFDSASGRYPFDSTAEQVSQDLGVRLSVSTNFTEKTSLTLSHGQDVNNTEQSLTYAKFNYDLTEERSLYFIQRYDRYEDRAEGRSLVGLETPIAYNTTSFVEYQMEDTVNGNQIRQSIGLRNLFELGEGFFGNASYEKLNTISGEAGANRPDGFASTVSTTYLPTDKWRLTARAELRDETELRTKLGEVGVATELSEALSLLGRARFFDTEGIQSGAREDIRVSAGMAWRPVNNDRFQGLARLDWWQQDRAADLLSFNEDKLFGAIEGIYQFTDQFSVSAKYAGKQYELGNYSLYNDLYSVRGSYLINDRWEIGATIRTMNEHDFDNKMTGGAIDVGFRLWEFIWVTVGYSLDDFDSDLTGAGYSGEGVFAKFRFKFDENILSDF